MKRVLLSLLIVLVLFWSCGTTGAQGQGKGKKAKQIVSRPPGWNQGKKQGWKTEFPPGWENWDNAKKQQWQHGLNRAKNAVRKHTEARLNASLRALEMAARKGTPLNHAEEMAKAGLERGLGPFDFEPLGKFVVERVRAGLKGEDLATTIHQEINRRQQQRRRLHEEMKENIKQRQEERKGLHQKLKEKKDLGKPRKGRSLDKEGEEQEKDRGKHARPHPKEGEDKGRARATKAQKRGGGRKTQR